MRIRLATSAANIFTRRKQQRIELRRKLRSFVEPEVLEDLGAPAWLAGEYAAIYPALPSLQQVERWMRRLQGDTATRK
ncbi:MAG: hypothetical protein AAFV43_11785 [Planctomycetota bacterium]